MLQEVYPLPVEYQWDLRFPRELAQFFYFLRTLKSHLQTELEEDFRGFDFQSLSTTEAKAWRARWRYPFSSERVRTEHGGELTDNECSEDEQKTKILSPTVRDLATSFADKNERIEKWREDTSHFLSVAEYVVRHHRKLSFSLLLCL